MSYIKLDRKLLNWEWKDVPEMVALWVEILLQANYRENKWQGETYEKGSFPTSLDKLAKNTGLSVKKIRTCLKRLEESGEIGTQRANKGTKIIVINWELYQGSDSNDDDNWANKGQTKGKQRATLKEIKERKEIKNIYNSPFQMGEYDNSNNPQFSEERKQRLKRRRNENKRDS